MRRELGSAMVAAMQRLAVMAAMHPRMGREAHVPFGDGDLDVAADLILLVSRCIRPVRYATHPERYHSRLAPLLEGAGGRLRGLGEQLR